MPKAARLAPKTLSALLLAVALRAQDLPRVATELPADLKTVETLKALEPKGGGPKRLRPVLGIRFGSQGPLGAEIQGLDAGSPAAGEGLLPGDQVRVMGRFKITEADDLEKALAALRIGERVTLSVRRPAVRREAIVELGPGEKAGDHGFDYRHTQGRFAVTAVRAGSAAARGGIKVGDTFTQVDRVIYSGATTLRRALAEKVKFTVLVEREESTLEPTLKPIGAKEEEVIDWKGKTFNLAVLLVEFSDRKHNPKYGRKDFERLMFSVDEYTQAPDGRAVFGSVRDYYKEISVGAFDVHGKVFDWVQVPETWSYYDAQDLGSAKPGCRTIFQDALKGARDKHGGKALDGFDGVVFLYAGPRDCLRGSQLWPHRASVQAGGRDVPYYIIEEGGEALTSIGVHCHEFGHMLGLPDFYGYGHRTGLGKFCVMSIGHLGGAPSGSDRPFHMCAWCKIRLGWMTARTILPTERQHIALRGVEGRTTEALKIPLSPSGEEYYLLEVRDHVGFDRDFFGEGLLIWHVGDDDARERGQISVSIDLVEAHGKRYFDASLREEGDILFPNGRLTAFTPLTVPSSRSSTVGSSEVALTDIQVYLPPAPEKGAKIPPGSVLLWIGDRTRAQTVTRSEPEQPKYPEHDPVNELDPVTMLPVPFTVDKNGVAAPGPAIMPRVKPGEEPPKEG